MHSDTIVRLTKGTSKCDGNVEQYALTSEGEMCDQALTLKNPCSCMEPRKADSLPARDTHEAQGLFSSLSTRAKLYVPSKRPLHGLTNPVKGQPAKLSKEQNLLLPPLFLPQRL